MRWFGKHGRQVQCLRVPFPIPEKEDAADESDWRQFGNGLAAILALTPHLHTLDGDELEELFVPEESLYIFKELTLLRSISLDMRSNGSWKESTLQPLSHLKHLHHLCLVIAEMDTAPMLLSPGISSLTGLTFLSLTRISNGGEHVIDMPNLTRAVSGLTNLGILSLAGVVDSIPASFSNLRQLKQLTVRDFEIAGPAITVPAELHACSTLEKLHLEDLSNASAQAFPEMCNILCQLPCLCQLEIDSDNLSDIDASACNFSSNLTELELICGMTMLPPSVRCMTNLRSLSFYHFDARGNIFPPVGPYLHGLTRLEIGACPGNITPGFLQAAGNLQYLRMCCTAEQGQRSGLEQQSFLDHLPAACLVDVNGSLWQRRHL